MNRKTDRCCWGLVSWLMALPLSAQVVLTPVQDRDVYQGTNAATTTLATLGVSASAAFGGGHSQKSLIQFAVTETTTGLTAGQVGKAVLRLYLVAPEVYPGGFDLGGTLHVSFQQTAWSETAPLYWWTPSAGERISELTLVADREYNDGRGTRIYPLYEWVEVDVTRAVKAWLAGDVPNYGFVLEADEEGSPYVNAAFADSITGWKPELVITPAEEQEPEPLQIVEFSYQQGMVELSWKSLAGERYRVEESPDLRLWSSRVEIVADADRCTARFEATRFAQARGFFQVVHLSDAAAE